MELNAQKVVQAISDVYTPGKQALLLTPENCRWIDTVKKTVQTIESIVYDDPNQETHVTKLEGIGLHPRPRPEKPGELHVNSPEMLGNADLLIFIENIPDIDLPESKAVHLFIGIEQKEIGEKIHYIKHASPDIADPQFIVDGWVSSIRDGYSYYGYRKGSKTMPGPPQRVEDELPPPKPPELVVEKKPWYKRLFRR